MVPPPGCQGPAYPRSGGPRVSRWLGGGLGRCVRQRLGKRGLDWIGDPKGLPPVPEAPPVGCLRCSGAAAEKPPLHPTRSPLPTQFRALPPEPSRSTSSARAPFYPARRQGPGPPHRAAARRPLPSPGLRSHRRGAPTRPHPRGSSVERRETEARGEQWREQVEGRRGPGPSGRRGTGSERGSLSPQARARAAGTAPPPGRCRHLSRRPGTALGAGEGIRACAHPFIWNLWQLPGPTLVVKTLRGRGVGGLISGPEREQRQAWPGGKAIRTRLGDHREQLRW